MNIESVGVLGVGNIGTEVVTDLVLHGIRVVAFDLTTEILERAKTKILKNIRFAPLLSKSAPRVSKDGALKQMHFTTSFADLSSCEFIIENVTEDWQVKKVVYEKLDRVMPSEVCFGANTSCISITKIGSVTKRPANVVGIHL